MALIYPLTLPTTKLPQQVRFTAINTVGVSRSPFTHSQQIQEFSGQSWMAEVVYPQMTREEAEAFNVFLLGLMGQKGTFLLGDPLGKLPRGQATGNPLVNGGGQTGNTLITDGWTPSITGILLAGDYIQIVNKLYKVLADANSDASGNCTLEIWPRLAVSPSDNESIITQSASGIFRLSENITPIYEANEERFYSVSFSAIEAK
jgi:hypothetical protein